MTMVGVPDGINLLDWWDKSSDKYPKLSQIALKFSIIPLGSVSSESTFSKANIVYSKHRTRLQTTQLGHIIFMKDKIDGH